MISEYRGRRIVKERSDGWCEICSLHRSQGVSHRISRGRGGTWSPTNLVAACGSGTTGCHGQLEANPLLAAAGGWHIRRDPRKPEEVPVFLRVALAPHGAWFLLCDDGEMDIVDPSDYDLPAIPAWEPWRRGRPLHTVPWVDPR